MNLVSNETSQRGNIQAIWPPLQWFALFLLVVGVRLWMISIYSSSLPIRDQWDYEGATVFKPWLDGTFRVSDLFRPHNGHTNEIASCFVGRELDHTSTAIDACTKKNETVDARTLSWGTPPLGETRLFGRNR